MSCGGSNRIAMFAIGPAGLLSTPDTRTAGDTRNGRSTFVRSSPDRSVIVVASDGSVVPGYSVAA